MLKTKYTEKYLEGEKNKVFHWAHMNQSVFFKKKQLICSCLLLHKTFKSINKSGGKGVLALEKDVQNMK